MERAAGAQPPSPLGTVLDGRYRLEAHIATGGTSTIYRALHVGTERPVAIKILDGGLLRDDTTVQRFLAEARITARVSHPNVVEVLDVGRDPERRPYIVAELLEGETLASYLTRSPGPLPVQELAALLLPLLDALALAHERGVVHRDFKPENVFLRAQGDGSVVPKLLDFGISKELDPPPATSRAHTTPGVAIGTPHYIAPEQARGLPDITARADIWSAGVVLYRLLVGRVPFDGADVHDVLARVLEATPPTPAGYGAPPALSAVVMRCLAKDPLERYEHGRALKAALCLALGLPMNAGAPARVSLPSIQVAPAPEAAVTVPPPAPWRAPTLERDGPRVVITPRASHEPAPPTPASPPPSPPHAPVPRAGPYRLALTLALVGFAAGFAVGWLSANGALHAAVRSPAPSGVSRGP